MKQTIIRSALSLAISAACLVNVTHATDTAALIRGAIQAPAGKHLKNAQITITHQPSGLVKNIQVNESGEYRAHGLRLGGPYTVVVSAAGYQSKAFSNIYLQLNDSYDLSAQLALTDNTETIVVTAPVNRFTNAGASSVFSENEINQSALINRDLKDIVRKNPLAVLDVSGSELTIAGSNPKFNSLTIDGVGINDTFGLNANGYPASRPPISMNAVEQIAIDYAPFSARASNFTGGTVNVVTKSGTNETFGDFFYEWTPQNGSAKDDKLNPGAKFDFDNNEVTFGGALGGAIVKDKLFYFVSYEKWSDDVIFNYDLNTLDGHNVTLAEAQQVLTAFDGVYGFTDSIGSVPPKDSDEKLLMKFDWQINNDHRLDFTFSDQENTSAKNYTNDGNRLRFSSNQYSQDAETRFITSHLFSDWNDNFSSEINVSYKEHQQIANTNSALGEIAITTSAGSIWAGQPKHRHGNEKTNETTILAFHGLYLLDETELKFGLEYENITNTDLYAHSAAGRWAFNSIADFENKEPSNVVYANAYTNDMNDLTATIESDEIALYVEANQEIFTDFTLSAGLRYERLSVDSKPNHNQNYADTYGYSNATNLDGFDIFLPRVAFNWDLSERLTLRGGVGRYVGGMPLVWLSNAYTNDGITNVSATPTAVGDTIDNPDKVTFDQVPDTLQDSLEQGNGSTNTVAADFELPSDWRYQIATDILVDLPLLGNDVAWTTELIYVERKNSATWFDQARVKNGETVEGRTLWESRYTDPDKTANTDIQLQNDSNGGRSKIISTALSKAWKNGVSFNASYTYQDITEKHPGDVSTASSAYYHRITVDRNESLLGRASYEIEHRLLLNLGYQHEFFSGYNTSVNLFFERRSGRPFSWTLGKTSIFDQIGSANTYLPYLPSSATDAAFEFSDLSYQEIIDIAQAAGVSGHAGGYVPKNSAQQPWLTTMDLAITQELPGLLDGHKGQLYFVIDNLANLLNDDWGKSYSMSSRQQVLFDVDVNDSDQYILSEAPGGTNTKHYNRFDVEQSAWSLKVGVKYSF